MGSACCKSAEDELQRSSFSEVSGVVHDEPDVLLAREDEVSSKRQRKKSKSKKTNSLDKARGKHLEDTMLVLFNLHDLNSNGYLEEDELVQLNSKVAMLHHGKDTDLAAVKAKYRALFREKLDPQGKPVLYAVFRRYVLQVLDGLDPDPLAQEMIVEQFAAEARSARAVFHVDSFASQSDQLYLSKLTVPSFLVTDESSLLGAGTSPIKAIDPDFSTLSGLPSPRNCLKLSKLDHTTGCSEASFLPACASAGAAVAAQPGFQPRNLFPAAPAAAVASAAVAQQQHQQQPELQPQPQPQPQVQWQPPQRGGFSGANSPGYPVVGPPPSRVCSAASCATSRQNSMEAGPFAGVGMPAVSLGHLVQPGVPTARPSPLLQPTKVGPLQPAARMPARLGGA